MPAASLLLPLNRVLFLLRQRVFKCYLNRVIAAANDRGERENERNYERCPHRSNENKMSDGYRCATTLRRKAAALRQIHIQGTLLPN